MIGIWFFRATDAVKARRVHDLKVFFQRFLVAETLVSGCIRIALGVGRVDTVDIGRLKDGVAIHFGGPQHRRRVPW